ncbi:MAG: response regulator [Firmicutes bacterium]|nr:response regulator [[Eubacterium] siraeum]MCM1487198.1 response regulator [Bacillota bacterium]
MYRFCINFYLLGANDTFDLIKQLQPLENFTHKYAQSTDCDRDLAKKANVIFAALYDRSEKEIKQILTDLTACKRESSQLILLLNREQIEAAYEFSKYIYDIWTMPMDKTESDFRILKWQKEFKRGADMAEESIFFDAAINNSPNLIWFKNKDGIHEKVNNSFCETVRKEKSDVEGRDHAYIWNVEREDPACIESDSRVIREKRTCVTEEIIDTGDGKRLLTTYKSPVFDFDGEVMGTVGVAVDVTKEKEYEQQIISRNRTLEKVFDSIECGVMCHSLDGKEIISANDAALKILGYKSIQEMKDSGFDMIADSVMDEDKEKLRNGIISLKNEGDTVSIEYRAKHADGKIRYIMGNVRLLKENGEKFYRRYLLDVTAQKQAERDREKRQSELTQALSIDYNLVCFFNLDTGLGSPLRVIDCEKHVIKKYFNSNKLFLENCIKNYLSSCVYEEDKEFLEKSCTAEHLIKELSDKNSYSVNYRTRCEGNIKYFQVKAVRTGDWNENRHDIVLGFRSVDAEIRMEMEKNQLLEQSLMQAKQASHAKSTFLSNMSHDIRTPMNAIVGFTSMALSRIDKKEQVEEYLKKIMTSSNHLLGLINDVLDMSRIESGKMHLEEKNCRLSDILHSIRSILQSDVKAKQLELNIDTVNITHEEIICDKLRLNQVLINLLSNAVKYTPAGGTVSFVITEKEGAEEGRAYYEFLIKDTGIGMSEDFVEHIFEPFERERNSTISGIQGTGLGMAITKNIVDMMGGVIEVKSKQNVGTECTVDFTFKIGVLETENEVIPQLKNCRALVVDDDFNTCDSVSYMLQQIGLRGEWTLSGKEAVLRTKQAMMRDDNYGVYIVDCFLPDMNGIEVVRRIRREVGDEAPIIILTAYDWTEFEEEAREAGVNAFCSKPLFMSELRSCLTSVVNRIDDKKDENKKLRTGRILLTEDNELNQEIAVAILEDAGFSVEVANNGAEAIEKLKQSEAGYYQLVLMDIQMPVMNGYEAAKGIRKLEDKAVASIPILAMTANAFEEDKLEALRSGMNGHIAKPIDVDGLLSTLDEIMD